MRRLSRVAVVGLLFTLIGIAGPAWLSASQKKEAKKAVPVSAATFEMYKDKSDEFRFRLKDADDELLASSGKGYKTKAECQKVIDAIKKNATTEKVDDKSGKGS